MLSQLSHETDTRNERIAATFDSVEGYTEAAKNFDGDRFVALSQVRAVEREAVITS